MPFKDQEKKREWDRLDYRRHPERNKAKDARRDQRRYNIATRYGITVKDYDRMVEAQVGACSCCGKEPSTKRLCVDHNHRNGQVRGLLCDHCNIAICMLEHPNLPKWQDYLEKHAITDHFKEYATPDEIAAYLGTRNWVVTRRTPKIIARYGEDVVCLSGKKFRAMQAEILAAR